MYPSRSLVAKTFAQSSGEYEKESHFHQVLARELVYKLKGLGLNLKSILEIGSHTGLLTRLLKDILGDRPELICLDIHKTKPILSLPHNQNPSQTPPSCSFVQADAEFLPFKDASFDLIASGSTFQWLRDWEASLQALVARLKPGGVLAFTQFIEPSLEPFKSILKDIDSTARFLPLRSSLDFDSWCEGKNILSRSQYTYIKNFSSHKDLFKSLRRMGVNSSEFRNQAITSRQLKELLTRMDEKKVEGFYPLKFKAEMILLKN